MELRLLVIRSKDPYSLSNFYSQLGLKFEYHTHGNSPMHYSGKIGKTILELYPLAKSQSQSDNFLRLGFQIENFEDVLINLKNLKIEFQSEPIDTEFGHMAIVVDPDGRKVELYKK